MRGDYEGAPETRREVRARRRAARRDARSQLRTARREARIREREALKQLPRRKRLGAWWRARPLGVTFAAYLAAYLTAATLLSLAAIDVLAAWNNEYYELEVTFGNGLTRRSAVDSGPYIYDPNTQELLPASELNLPGDEPLAVFIATGEWEAGDDFAPEDSRAFEPIYATVDLVRSGQVRLYDWGLNYNDYYPQEEILEENSSISADNLPRYDELSRENRVQSVELFGQKTGADLEETFGAGRVSNTAYYAASHRSADLLSWLLTFATGLAPVLAYGVLGWVMFHRFYRVHIADPLGELAVAAERIAGEDLDFHIDPVRGRELGRLSRTLEDMRAALLETHRELWRTAEGRRRLNAAFAHDLRTPVTVLKGTVEMAKMRIASGAQVGEGQLDTLAAQVARLERYATVMGGLTKLEDRAVEREEVEAGEALRRLSDHAAEVVAARGEDLRLVLDMGTDEFGVSGTAGAAGAAAASGEPGAPDSASTLWLDLSLAEEVLDNLLSNACGHAETQITVAARVFEGKLALRVTDDGPGFSPEALHRGCDPFYSENKSAEHFGLGLNVSNILCELHGGTLALSNVAPHGACVEAVFGTEDPVFVKAGDPPLKRNEIVSKTLPHVDTW